MRSVAQKIRDRLKRQGIWISLLVVLAIARLFAASLVGSNPDRFLFPDSEAYLDLANNLAESGQYTSSERPMEDARRPPLYPLFLAGANLAFDANSGTIALAHLALQGFTAGLLYRSGKRLRGETAGLLAAGIFLLSPNSLFWALPVMSETLFAFLLALATYFYVIGAFAPSTKIYLFLGVSLAACALTRPAGAIFIPLFAIFILFHRGKGASARREAVRNAAIFLIVAALPLLVWAGRNLALHGKFTLSTTLGITLTQYVAADTLADGQGITREEARAQIPRFSESLSFNLDVIRRYPGSFIKLSGKGIFRTVIGTEVGTWMTVALGQSYAGSGILEAIASLDLSAVKDSIGSLLGSVSQLGPGLLLFWGLAYTMAIFVLGTFGAVRGIRAGDAWLVAPLVLGAMALMIMPLSSGEARFRVPIEPFLTLLCGFAAISIGPLSPNQARA